MLFLFGTRALFTMYIAKFEIQQATKCCLHELSAIVNCADYMDVIEYIGFMKYCGKSTHIPLNIVKGLIDIGVIVLVQDLLEMMMRACDEI